MVWTVNQPEQMMEVCVLSAWTENWFTKDSASDGK